MHADATRAVYRIAGDDRVTFLQGILTQDINKLKPECGIFTALLSPQGKIQHDFFLIPQGDTILLDTEVASKDLLIKRLTMYKLRAKVTIEDVSDRITVAYRLQAEHATIGHVTHKKNITLLTDPRAAELGERLYIEDGTVTPKHTITPEDYHAHRIALGIPDGMRDVIEDTALDAGYDALGAISFNKGCYVGQEVTARMHYKNIARRGFYHVEAQTPLPARGSKIMADGITIGELRGTDGVQGLAMLKFEEAEAALERGAVIQVDDASLYVTSPAWLHSKLAQFRAAREKQ